MFRNAPVMHRTQRWLDLLELPKMEIGSRLAESLADLISWNEESLIEDSTQLLKVAKKPKLLPRKVSRAKP